MKKTVNINVSGQLFHVDEDAYEVLSRYLKSLEHSLDQQEGGREIYLDLEARIAELFHEKRGSGSQIVSLILVEEVIQQIGTPEEMLGDSHQPSFQQEGETSKVISRRLFRDGEEKMIGGVAAGIAAYFQIDPTVVRVLAAILIFSGIGFGFYLLLWIVIPEAKTPAERLRMKGESVNLKNLQDQAKQEIRNMESKMNGWLKKEPQNIFERFLAFLHQIFRFFLKIISKIVRWILLAIFICFLVTLVFFLIGIFFTGIQIGSNHFLPSEISSFLSHFLPEGFDAFSFWAIGFLLVLAPIYGVVSISIRLIFQLPKNNPILKKVNASVGILTAIGWILAFVLGVQLAMEFRTHDLVTQKIALPNSLKYTLVNEQIALPKSEISLLEEGVSWFMDQRNWYQNQVEIEVNDSPDSTAFAQVVKYSRGKDREKAHQSAESIRYTLKVDSAGTIILPRHFSFPNSQAYRGQKIDIQIFLPKNSEIHQKIDDRCTFPTIDRRENSNITHLY